MGSPPESDLLLVEGNLYQESNISTSIRPNPERTASHPTASEAFERKSSVIGSWLQLKFHMGFAPPSCNLTASYFSC
jgi:hypothetical protein